MTAMLEVENTAGLTRVTCGWKKPRLSLDWVRCFWRDVHSPAIARRAGVYDYRHSQFDPVRSDVFHSLRDVEYTCPANEQLMWLSDVRYRDEDALVAFARSPDGEASPPAGVVLDVLGPAVEPPMLTGTVIKPGPVDARWHVNAA